MENLKSKIFTFENVNYEFWGIKNEHIFEQVPWYEYGLLSYIKSLNISGAYIDVGGNIGNHSLFFLNHCPSTKIYTFEPEDGCFWILNKNLEQNTKKEFKLFNYPLWSSQANLKLIKYESMSNMGMSKVYENKDGDIVANYLDNVISFNENIGLIKIDAEGSEPKVLLGALELIKLNMPVIICEAATIPEFNAINQILLPLGYKQPIQRFNATPTYIWKT